MSSDQVDALPQGFVATTLEDCLQDHPEFFYDPSLVHMQTNKFVDDSVRLSHDGHFVHDASSEDESPEALGRVARKALDREIPWRLIVEPGQRARFVKAVQKQWGDWCKYGVVRQVPAH